MILHGSVVALTLGSLLVAGVVLYAAGHGVAILRHWDLASGSERQLALERRTYLVTTLVAWAAAFQLASLLLLVYVADDLSDLFVGAMCAAGTLALNGWGYPALLVKLATFFGAAVWLVLNHVDSRAPDYPLIRTKYALLLVLGPALAAELVLQTRFFAALDPHVITSCCGSLFSAGTGTGAASLFDLPRGGVQAALAATAALTAVTGVWLRARPGGLVGYLFGAAAGAAAVAAVAAFVTWLGLYYYESPTHRCPFCVFQAEHGYVGYLLYGCLLGGAVAALGAAALTPFRRRPSLAAVVPRAQRALAAAALVLYTGFGILAAWRVATSSLRL